MVSDVHRTLLNGGIFLDPKDKSNPNGKLKLLYEIIPMSYLCVKAGGKAISASSNILKITPESIHQTSPIILGSIE